MSDTKFTPGPWVAKEHHPENEIATVANVGCFQVGIEAPGFPGGNYRDNDLSAETEDARLIAAAPDLYAALDDVLREAVILSDDYLSAFEHEPNDHCIQCWDKARWLRASAAANKARAALARARGES